MKILATKSQVKMLANFCSNFSIAWLAFALISGTESPVRTISGILNGIGLFVLSFKLSE